MSLPTRRGVCRGAGACASRAFVELVPQFRPLVFDFELALFRHTLKSLARILDAVLIIFAVRWQQPNDLVAATGAGATDRARGIEHGLTDLKFVRAKRRS